MWNRAWMLSCRVRIVKNGIKTFNMWFPIPFYILNGLILSCDGILAFIPGEIGQKVRAASDTLYQIINAITDEPGEELVHIDVNEKSSKVFVDIRTIGIFENRDKVGRI